MPEHVTDETGKINDGDIMVIKLMQVFLADSDPSPINSPLMRAVIWNAYKNHLMVNTATTKTDN